MIALLEPQETTQANWARDLAHKTLDIPPDAKVDVQYLVHTLKVHSVACDQTYHEYGRNLPLSLVLTTAVVELMKLGSQPRSDYGIFIIVGIDRQPLKINEYKQQTDTDVGSVTCADMAELFLHGYYILKKH